MGCPQGTSESAAGEMIVNPGAAADDALPTVAMYRLVIATMQTIRAASSAANRILFLCMGACLPLPPRRAPRVLNACELSGAYSRLPRAGVLASLLLAQQMLGFEDDLSSLLPAAQSFEYEASGAADVCCPVPPHRAGEGGVDCVLAQSQSASRAPPLPSRRRRACRRVHGQRARRVFARGAPCPPNWRALLAIADAAGGTPCVFRRQDRRLGGRA